MKGRITWNNGGVVEDYVVLEEDAVLYILVDPNHTILSVHASTKGVYDALFARLSDRTDEIDMEAFQKKQKTAIYNAITDQEYDPDDVDLDELLGYQIVCEQLRI